MMKQIYHTKRQKNTMVGVFWQLDVEFSEMEEKTTPAILQFISPILYLESSF